MLYEATFLFYKYFKNNYKKACFVLLLVVSLYHNNKQNNKKMTLEQKKQEILNVIFKRADELEEKAIEVLKMTTAKNIDYVSLQNSALKKALQEWKENAQVFDKPAFL